MRTQIKKYVLNKNLTEQILIDNGFKYVNERSDIGIYGPVYFYFKTIYDDIELHVEIGINDDGTLSFNDPKNVLVFDDECGQMYHPFYREDVDTPYVNSVIAGYNEAMDYLASKGILKEKTMEDNIDKDIIFQDYKPLVIGENTIQTSPNNILFVDDTELNMKNAQNRGWNTCQAYGYELDKIKTSVENFLNRRRDR